MPDTNQIKPPDWSQRELVESELETNMLVEAAAGTGKTTKIVDRMVALVASGKCRLENMAAVTFTRKAASELRSRFQLELESRARPEPSGQGAENIRRALEHLDRCFIGTIHSFCARLLRERPVEAGVDPDFREVDEEQDRIFREQAWQEFLASMYAQNSPLLAELQKLAIEPARLEHAFMALCNYPDVKDWPAPELDPPDAETCRRKLADYARHMQQIASSLSVDPGNDKLIPAYGLIPRMVRQSDLSSLPQLARILAVFKKVKIVHKMWHGGKEQALAELERWDDFRQQQAEPFLVQWRAYCYSPVLRTLRSAVEHYRSLRNRHGVLNYEDLLLGARRLLRDNHNVRAYFSRRITHLLVDEFQDTDPVQAEVMLLLTADDPRETNWRRCRPRPGSLFVVGDPKQSIYRFRRADIVTYSQVKKIILANGGLVVPLSANFRAGKNLIDWVNKTFRDKFEDNTYSPAYVELKAAREEDTGKDPGCVKNLLITEDFRNKDAIAAFEPEFAARVIRNILDIEAGGTEEEKKPDFLVITYGKKNLDLYAERLEKLDIPHQVTGSGALGALRQLWLLYLCLAALTRPDDPLPLVAALRSPLFGFSDPDLYSFVKAGGVFSYRSQVPESLEPEKADLFRETFGRFKRYSGLLGRMAPLSAVERIAGDLGLFASAAAEADGNQRAGTFARALELLRHFASETSTLSALVDYLGRLARGEIPCDSMPAAVGESPVVRLMNLHKAKGLEAQVVFLADPFGVSHHPLLVHVDRSGGQTRGYLAIREEDAAGRPGSLIAHHPDWQHWEQEEQKFLEAEKVRLFYVAATRAGDQLIITQREKSNHTNPWNFFAGHLKDCPDIEYPGKVRAPVSEGIHTSERELPHCPGDIAALWSAVLEPGYRIVQARQAALETGVGLSAAGEHGTEWGRAIHRLLQAKMEDPHLDLRNMARWILSEEELAPGLETKALGLVKSVTGSEIWRRAVSSEKCLVEVPFQLLQKTGRNDEILRGVIDLAFRESDGWVIVDYKTDQGAESALDHLVSHYAPQVELYAQAWSRAVGEKVKERGLYFTAINQYIIIQE